MPLIQIKDTEEGLATPTNAYAYSAAKLSVLAQVGGSEFTLVTIYSDVSTSVSPFKSEMEKCLRDAITGLKEWGEKSGRSNMVLVRWVTFSSDVQEQHGFRLLAECDPDSYQLHVGGSTHFYEAITRGSEALADYAGTLAKQAYLVNAISIAIGDGAEYPGDDRFPVARVKLGFEEIRAQHEEIESHVGILVGVNVQQDSVRRFLATFEAEAGWDHMVQMEDFETGTATDLANLLVTSISTTSIALGTGGPSVTLGL